MRVTLSGWGLRRRLEAMVTRGDDRDLNHADILRRETGDTLLLIR